MLATPLIPVVVALAWVPLRDRLPNTDVALVLVIATGAVGLVGVRRVVLAGAVLGAMAFDVLHTRPYGSFAITRHRDVLTTVLLVVAGWLAGEVTSRLSVYRFAARAEAAAFALVTDAASVVATGGEPGLVVEALGEELRVGLRLASWSFRFGPPDPALPVIGRQGDISGPTLAAAGSACTVALPVWASGAVRAHYELRLPPAAVPTPAQCRLAVSIADQAGAALSSAPPGPHTPSGGRRRTLRLVRTAR